MGCPGGGPPWGVSGGLAGGLARRLGLGFDDRPADWGEELEGEAADVDGWGDLEDLDFCRWADGEALCERACLVDRSCHGEDLWRGEVGSSAVVDLEEVGDLDDELAGGDGVLHGPSVSFRG